ncbi:MAG: ABC transporter permease subunit [Kiritimatiellae bacterium]|nr:ABC transporter permease subunit [Kiritimatiellia bacterium]
MRGLGDTAHGASATSSIGPEQRKAIEAHFGFDKPIPQRYWKWLWKDRMGLRVDSYLYPNKTVWELIVERFPVSLVFGLTGFFLTYLVCIPLGIAKALRHGGAFDLVSSLLVFTGYAIPAFAFGMLLKSFFCGTTDFAFDWFPVAGFHSIHFDTFSFWGKTKDIARHMFLPVLCYMIGNFAVLTLLMKNSMMEQISQDYIRTVLAKGGSMRRALWGHALRNALIPIATGIGGVLTVMFAGSVLIEKVFEIPGMGRLSLEAIVSRDYMLFMGILGLTSLLGLVGRIVSDLCYVLIDPRIHFQS